MSVISYSLESIITFLDATTNVLTVTNCGINELSQKKIDIRMKPGPENHIISYTAGWLAGIGGELGFLAFCLYELAKGNPEYIAANTAIKGIGLSIGYTYKKSNKQENYNKK